MAQRGRPRKDEGEAFAATIKHPMIKAFGEQYLIIPWDGGYLLYDYKRECKRANAMYIGKFYLSNEGNKYVFRDERYESKEALIEAMDKYNATLPFAADVYDPSHRKNYNIECAAYDYLTSLGFKHDRCAFRGEKYTLSDVYGNYLCEIQVKTNFDSSVGKVVRRIVTSEKKEMWQEAHFEDLETAVAAINSIVVGYLSVVQAQLMNALRAMTTSRSAVMLEATLDVNTLSTFIEDARQKTIDFLEAELKRLKSE